MSFVEVTWVHVCVIHEYTNTHDTEKGASSGIKIRIFL